MAAENREVIDWLVMNTRAQVHSDIQAAYIDNPWRSTLIHPVKYTNKLSLPYQQYAAEIGVQAEQAIQVEIQAFMEPLLEDFKNTDTDRLHKAVQKLMTYLYRWGFDRSDEEQDTIIDQVKPAFDRLEGLGLISHSFRVYYESRYRMAQLSAPTRRR